MILTNNANFHMRPPNLWDKPILEMISETAETLVYKCEYDIENGHPRPNVNKDPPLKLKRAKT